MLISKRARPVRRKTDWYSSKVRVHFDYPLSREQAEQLVTDPIAVTHHPFLPLIAFPKKERRFRRKAGEKTPSVSIKIRELAYPSHRDGYIFAFYAERLGKLYEAALAARGLGSAIIGYRKNCSNIRLAREAFDEIQARGDCVAIALDIKAFFDNISHDVLKSCWSSLLGGGQLPDDHYAVYKALTAAAKVSRAKLLEQLGFPTNARDHDLPRPLCTVAKFRALRSASGASQLVQRSSARHGIPQGTPLSGMAANLAMLEFDTAVQTAAVSVGASYRRYSDDILLLCPPEHAGMMEQVVENALRVHTKTLALNPDKREVAHFTRPGPVLVATPPRLKSNPFQYLGFAFDGSRVFLRDGTLSRYYRRAAAAIRAAKADAAAVQSGRTKGRPAVHKRELLAKHSHLGRGNFVTSYASDAARIMGLLGSESIRRQLSGHMNTLQRRLSD